MQLLVAGIKNQLYLRSSQAKYLLYLNLFGNKTLMMGRNSYSDKKIFGEKTQLLKFSFNFYLTFNNVSNVLFMLVSMLLHVTSQRVFGVLKSCRL